MILCETLKRIHKKNYHPSDWNDMLFLDDNTNNPLGLYDPLLYITELINVLSEIFDNERDALKNFISFKLAGPNILQGKREEGDKWKTIIAYCGGRQLKVHENKREYTTKPCLTNPLFLGASENCDECGKLICNKCGHCGGPYCPESQKRQEDLVPLFKL